MMLSLFAISTPFCEGISKGFFAESNADWSIQLELSAPLCHVTWHPRRCAQTRREQTDTPPVSVKSSISDQRLLTSPFALTFSATPVTNPDPPPLPAEPDGRQCKPLSGQPLYFHLLDG
jgi:hypothetical protein